MKGESIMNELNIEKRIENVLNILNGLTLTGFQQFNAVAEAMKQLGAISRDVQAEKAKEAMPEESPNEGEHFAE